MNMNKMITFAAVAASAAIPMAATAATENITFTTNGVTWRIRLEPEADSYLSEYGSVGKVAGTAMLGINTSCNDVDNWRNSSITAIADQNVTVDASLIPWEFDYNGTHYTVTKIALAAFNKYSSTDATLTGTVTIPAGESSVTVKVATLTEVTGVTSLTLTLSGGSSLVGDPGSATMSVTSVRDPAALVWAAGTSATELTDPAHWTPSVPAVEENDTLSFTGDGESAYRFTMTNDIAARSFASSSAARFRSASSFVLPGQSRYLNCPYLSKHGRKSSVFIDIHGSLPSGPSPFIQWVNWPGR